MAKYHDKKVSYAVTDSRGKVHTRKSARVYSHCVVTHYAPTVPGEKAWHGDGASFSSWCGRADLAHREAESRRGRQNVEGVEIIAVPAVQS